MMRFSVQKAPGPKKASGRGRLIFGRHSQTAKKSEEATNHVYIVRVSSSSRGVHAGLGTRRRVRADPPGVDARECTQAACGRHCSRRLGWPLADCWVVARVLFR